MPAFPNRVTQLKNTWFRRESLPDEANTNSHTVTACAWWNPWHWPAGIWALVIGIFLLMLPFGIRAVMLSTVPEVQDLLDVAEFVKWDVPEEENAFADYRRAYELRPRPVTSLQFHPEVFDAVLELGWSNADEALILWLGTNYEALCAWRSGTEKQQGLHLSPDKLIIDSTMEVVQDLRWFARLAMLEAARCLNAGNLDEAWNWARAAQRSGGHASHRGCLIQSLVGASIHAMSSEGLVRWAEQPALTSEQIKRALMATRSDYGMYESRTNMLKVEVLLYRNTCSSPEWVRMIGQNDEPQGPGGMAAVQRMGYWVVGEPELGVRLLGQLVANEIQEIDKPLASRRKAVGTGRDLIFDPNPAVPKLAGQLDPAAIDGAIKRSSVFRNFNFHSGMFDSLFRQEARQGVLEAVLAAQAYRRDHGEFPEKLSQLIPDYLSSVPLDPLNPAGGTLLYRRDAASKSIVWSVGNDGVDGGGNFATSAKAQPTDVGFELK